MTLIYGTRRPVMDELDVVAQWLWLLWRVLMFCALLCSPAPLHVPDGLLRLRQALRSLRRAVPSLESQRAETPYPFLPDDGERLRTEYQAAYGPRGEALVRHLGDSGRYHVAVAGPKEYLTPPAAPAHTRPHPAGLQLRSRL